MNVSAEVLTILQKAVDFSIEQKYSYVTPETILYCICDDPLFCESFEECGGDIEVLKKNLTDYLDKYIEKDGKVKASFSVAANQLISYASQSAESSGNEEVLLRHVLRAIFQFKMCYASYYILEQGVEEADFFRTYMDLEEDYDEDEENDDSEDEDEFEYDDFDEDEDNATAIGDLSGDIVSGGKNATTGKDKLIITPQAGNKKASQKSGKPGKSDWQLYAPCMNDTADEANPLIGREEELERTIQILCRKDKNNPLHIGEPGVGKTAITYGLVKMINEGRVPEPLKGAKVYMLDMAGMIAGTQYRGDFEKRFKSVLGEIEKQEKPIVYLDEIHNILGAGAVGEGSFDAANMLKSYLSGGHIRFIGATTFDEYKKHFEKNKSMVRRFQNIEIKEPSYEETVKILKGLKPKYEEFHDVIYADGVLEYAVEMSAKHINERFLPDKAIDLIDEAGAYRKLHLLPKSNVSKTGTEKNAIISDDKSAVNPAINKKGHLEDFQRTVDKDVINTVLTKICRVPIETVETDDLEGLATLEQRMKSKVFGQDEAIDQVVNAIKFSKAGLLEDGKPLASLLFVGPTGVGKTEVARTLAEELGVKLVRFDMSEYEEKHAIAKLIGSPAGYVGYEEGGQLTEAIRKNPSSVLLLDEIEKAHADIYNVLLQVMDYATLTDNQGRKADFRNVVVIMTSNAGANRLGKTSIGFTSESLNESIITEEVKKIFQPEFRNRLNRIVVFRSMDDEMANNIINKKLGELINMLQKKNVTLTVDDAAKAYIKSKGVSQEFGAREIDRIIRNEVKPLFVDELLFGKLKDGGSIALTVKDSDLSVK
ncbi:MAG: AAA family ATPase [Lachnospiraceae bacterium]|nr:AAA family ATPase [Lachnospiraceae bacterium]